MAVITTVETREYMEHGKKMTVTITRHEGLATYTDNGRTFQAELATFMDYGPKLGVTRCYTPPRASATEEEKARNRANINAVANRVLRECGIW